MMGDGRMVMGMGGRIGIVDDGDWNGLAGWCWKWGGDGQ